MVTARNTVIGATVDVNAELAAINSGHAQRDGNTFVVNSRRYGIEPIGRIYPMAGSGLYPLDRGAYKALGIYNQFGMTDAAEQRLDWEHITEQSRAAARDVLIAEGRDS